AFVGPATPAGVGRLYPILATCQTSPSALIANRPASEKAEARLANIITPTSTAALVNNRIIKSALLSATGQHDSMRNHRLRSPEQSPKTRLQNATIQSSSRSQYVDLQKPELDR